MEDIKAERKKWVFQNRQSDLSIYAPYLDTPDEGRKGKETYVRKKYDLRNLNQAKKEGNGKRQHRSETSA